MRIVPTIGIMLLIIVGGMIMREPAILLVANRQVGYTVAHVATSLRLELIDALLASRWRFTFGDPWGHWQIQSQPRHTGLPTVLNIALPCLRWRCRWSFTGPLPCSFSGGPQIASFLVGIVMLRLLNELIRATRRAGTKQTHLLRNLLTYLSDVPRSVKSLKAIARIMLRRRSLEPDRQIEKATRREMMAREALMALQEPILATLMAIGLYLALVMWGLSLPAVMVMVFLLTRLLSLLNKTQRKYQNLMAQESAYWSLRTAIDEARAAAERSTGTRQPTFQKGISLRHIYFDYGSRPSIPGSRTRDRGPFIYRYCGTIGRGEKHHARPPLQSG